MISTRWSILYVGDVPTLASDLQSNISDSTVRMVSEREEVEDEADGFLPDCILIDSSIGLEEALVLVATIRTNCSLKHVVLIGLMDNCRPELEGPEGFSKILVRPIQLNALAEQVRLSIEVARMTVS